MRLTIQKVLISVNFHIRIQSTSDRSSVALARRLPFSDPSLSHTTSTTRPYSHTQAFFTVSPAFESLSPPLLMSTSASTNGNGTVLPPTPSHNPHLSLRSISSASSTSSPTHYNSIPHTPLHRHRLHPAYSHNLLQLWQSDFTLSPHDLVYPIFVTDATNAKQPIGSMAGQYRWSVDRLPELLTPLVEKGLRAVLLFGTLSDGAKKDDSGSMATADDNPVALALALLRNRFPSLYLMVDVCLCAYTSHGHCGLLLPSGDIDNQSSIELLSEMAVHLAQCGADCIAPSDMMDGRIGQIKQRLRDARLDHRITVCSYAVKFASCFYGPFRDAAGSGAKFGDRSRYQLPSASRSLALRAVDRDVEEGADMVMVKPAMPYLDLVREVKDRVHVPVAVYHVSGEYAMLEAGSETGAFELKTAVMEVLGGFRRAGASVLITYFTPLVLDILRDKTFAF